MNDTPNTKCGANKTDGSGTCGNGSGKGTDHPGFGHCYSVAQWREAAEVRWQDSWNRSVELCGDCVKVFDAAWREAEESVE